jgi:dTDP-4-dehydrorhamnose 3,5-epimerase-like enzyme
MVPLEIKYMKNDSINFIKLEKHLTKDIHDQHVNGSLTVIWRDWDKIIEDTPKMIYVTTIEPGEIKGPHLHLKRNSYFTCIRGKVVFIAKDKSDNYLEIESSEDDPVLVQIPHGYPSAHINIIGEQSTILTISDLAWKPNDNEMTNVTFDDYDWKKWIKN